MFEQGCVKSGVFFDGLQKLKTFRSQWEMDQGRFNVFEEETLAVLAESARTVSATLMRCVNREFGRLSQSD